MDLNKLYFFKIVAETGNITKAAEQLYTSQPFISRSIQYLEKELNAPLFIRSARGIELNETGQAYYFYIKNIFDNLEDGAKVVHEFKNLQDNTIKIGTNACSFLPSFFSYAKKTYLKLTIRQTTNSFSKLVALLREGEVDFVFAVCPKGIEELEGISSELLMMDQMNLIFPTDSPFAERKLLEFKEIADMPIITAPEGIGLTDTLRYQFSIHGAKPNIVIETSDIAIIPKYVANHLGLSAFPSFVMPDLIRAHDIVGVKLSNEFFVARLYLLWNNNRFQSSTAKMFLQMAKDYYLNKARD